MLSVSTAQACDLCAVYNSVDAQKPMAGSFRLGIAEQFTEYGKLQEDGHKIDNAMHQRLASSITQIVSAYDFSDSFGLQVSLPYVNRRFTRFHDEMLHSGTEAGIGDMTIIGRYNALQLRDEDTLFNVQLLGGVKVPTGDSDRLKEELAVEGIHPMEEMDVYAPITAVSRHEGHDHGEGAVPGAVHGHDLALGSGSFDYPLGITILAEKGRLFAKGGIIYTVRTAGDHDYQYADDLQWDFGPGYYVHLDHDSNIAARVVLSGENKSKDSGQGGAIQSDTGITSLFIGPELDFMVGEALTGEIALDLPADINNSGTQAVASYRMRTALTYRF